MSLLPGCPCCSRAVYCILYSSSPVQCIISPYLAPPRRQQGNSPRVVQPGWPRPGLVSRLETCRGAAGPGLGWDSLLTLVDVALQASALLRSDTATCQGGKPGGAPLLHSISNVPSLAWPGLTILISYRQSVTGFHTNIHIHAL